MSHFATDGRVTGRDMTGVDGWIAITAAQYASAREMMAAGKIATIVDGALALIDPPSPPDPEPPLPPTLDELKAILMGEIDWAAEVERLKHITGGSGQAMTYQRKIEEARRLIEMTEAEEDIDPAEFPMLSATIGIDGDTLADIAALVIAMDAAWAHVGAAIEAARLGAKAAIEAATDEAEARAVVAVWP